MAQPEEVVAPADTASLEMLDFLSVPLPQPRLFFSLDLEAPLFSARQRAVIYLQS
jgi:hypothetical protein